VVSDISFVTTRSLYLGKFSFVKKDSYKEVIKIPGWNFHRARMISQDKEDQDNILRLLDGSVRSLHMRYRAITHNEKAARKLALIAALTSKNSETDFWAAYRDMVNHIEDDETYNKFFYQKKKDEEERV